MAFDLNSTETVGSLATIYPDRGLRRLIAQERIYEIGRHCCFAALILEIDTIPKPHGLGSREQRHQCEHFSNKRVYGSIMIEYCSRTLQLEGELRTQAHAAIALMLLLECLRFAEAGRARHHARMLLKLSRYLGTQVIAVAHAPHPKKLNGSILKPLSCNGKAPKRRGAGNGKVQNSPETSRP
jgi:hypothetical protein